MAIDFATIHARKSYQPIVGQLFSAHIVSALIDVLARLIKENQLREKHGEDTIGVLMKCGAFHAVAGTSFDDDKFVAELAKQIDQVQL